MLVHGDRFYGLHLWFPRITPILCSEHTSPVHKFVSNPIGELVLVQLVRKQFLDVVVEKVGEDFVVETEVVVELLRRKLDAVLD